MRMTKQELFMLRMKNKMTQEQFSELIGVTACTVGRWERGIITPSKHHQKEIQRLIEEKILSPL